MDDLRCITLRQPYAALVAHRIKRFEARSWSSSYRGPLLIHAGQRRPFNLTRQAEPPRIGAWAIDWGLHPDLSGATNGGFDEGTGFVLVEREDGATGPEDCLDYIPLHLGAVVAVAQLTDCIPIVGHGQIPEQPGLFIEDHHVHYAPDARCLWLCKHRVDDAIDTLDRIEDQRPYGHWEPGGWAWKLDDIRPLAEPVPATGRQGLWRPDPDLAAAVTEGNQP